MTQDVQWMRPDMPVTPPGPAEVTTVPHALLTPFERGPLRTLTAPYTWIRGAVHDETGLLVPASQRIGGYAGDHVVSADPVQVDLPSEAEELGGTWLYGGHWMGQFGHFLTETLTTLWPAPSADVRGVVFHRFVWGGARQNWQLRLLRRAGYRDEPRVVGLGPMRVERLLVPTRALVLNAYAHPEAVLPWHRVVESIRRPAPHERVYLSRRRYNAEAVAAGRPVRSDPERDALLDEAFAGRGFEIVYPEQLPVLDQVRSVLGAKVVAGAAGSSLHLSVFARPGTHVIEVADRRSPARPLLAQQVIDSVCGHSSALIPHELDANAASRALAGLGL